MRVRYWFPSLGEGNGVTKLFPRLGSGTNLFRKFTAGLASLEVGRRFPGNGSFDSGSMSYLAGNSCETSPVRMVADGTVAVLVVGVPRSCVPCHAPKKKVLFLRMGPPNCAPNWLRLKTGVVVEKKGRASKWSLRTNSNAPP